MEKSDLREYVTDAIKFWERWRLLYNLTLAAVVIVYFAIGYPLSKIVLNIDFCLALFLLAVVANVAYCAAYLVDIFAQTSGFREDLAALSQTLICYRHPVSGGNNPVYRHGDVPWQSVILTSSHVARAKLAKQSQEISQAVQRG